jgi:hypothetical protein
MREIKESNKIIKLPSHKDFEMGFSFNASLTHSFTHSPLTLLPTPPLLHTHRNGQIYEDPFGLLKERF